MKNLISACIVAGTALALPGAAQAQTDFTTAAKISCVPDSVTRCNEGKCTTRQASERDKTQVLSIDFGAKTVSMTRGGETRVIGKVTEDKVAGGVREIAMTEEGGTAPRKASMRLAKDGKLAIEFSPSNKADAICTAAGS